MHLEVRQVALDAALHLRLGLSLGGRELCLGERLARQRRVRPRRAWKCALG